MSEAATEVTTTAAADVASEPTELPVLPIMEHAAKFSDTGRQKDAEERANETPEQKTARQEAAAQQKRDKESGQFKEGKARHKAESQKAAPEDVPRINALTARAKTAEERAAAAEAEVARLRATHAPAAEVKRAEQKVEAAHASTFNEPEPTEDDPKFAGDYAKYLRAVSAWEGRKTYHESREAERAEMARIEKEQASHKALQTWAERVKATADKYDDFEAVAFGPTPIKADSVVDAFIMEDDNGPEVLYYLHQSKNRQELDSLLAKPVFEQVKHLALLSQRLLPESREKAGVTGSVAPRNTVILPPKPPNPVRTEAQRTTGGPPPTDGSLGVLAHARTFKRS